jgi:hypothetical protein
MRQKCHDKNCLVFANDSAIKTRAIDTDLGEKEISSLAARTSPTPQHPDISHGKKGFAV